MTRRASATTTIRPSSSREHVQGDQCRGNSVWSAAVLSGQRRMVSVRPPECTCGLLRQRRRALPEICRAISRTEITQAAAAIINTMNYASASNPTLPAIPSGVNGAVLRFNGFPENFIVTNPQFGNLYMIACVNSNNYHSMEAQVTVRPMHGSACSPRIRGARISAFNTLSAARIPIPSDDTRTTGRWRIHESMIFEPTARLPCL